MKRKKGKETKITPDDWEPPWMNPTNDRKTPYTEEELEEFAEGFMQSMSDTAALQKLIEEEGEEKARSIVKKAIKKKDGNNLENIETKGPIQ